MLKYLVIFTLLLSLSGPIMAQDKVAADYDQRLALAQELHKVLPAMDQVNRAIEKIAKTLPEDDQDKFRDRMEAAIDAEKIEKTSINAMAEVFSAEELQVMIAYYSKPEAKSISEKMPVYQSLVQPEITKMLDAALLALRTGTPPKAVSE